MQKRKGKRTGESLLGGEARPMAGGGRLRAHRTRDRLSPRKVEGRYPQDPTSRAGPFPPGKTLRFSMKSLLHVVLQGRTKRATAHAHTGLFQCSHVSTGETGPPYTGAGPGTGGHAPRTWGKNSPRLPGESVTLVVLLLGAFEQAQPRLQHAGTDQGSEGLRPSRLAGFSARPMETHPPSAPL